MNNKLLGIALTSQLLLAGCATTSHFGVRDRAGHLPNWIAEAESAIARSEASPGAAACPDRIARARRLAVEAMDVYWSCRDAEAKYMLGEARKLAAEAETCGGPAMASRMLELAAETLFAFNRASLTQQGENTLNGFLNGLRSSAYSGILIVGHTDPIGSDSYNQGLSERRAQTVALYLTKHGISGEIVRAEGHGERELKVTYQQCAARGAKSGAALINCYQPNRRVTVGLMGGR